MYFYKQTEPQLWTVGCNAPDWIPESDHGNSESAAKRVAFLNGQAHRVTGAAEMLERIEALENQVKRLMDAVPSGSKIAVTQEAEVMSDCVGLKLDRIG